MSYLHNLRFLIGVFSVFLCWNCSNDKEESRLLEVTEKTYSVGAKESLLALQVNSTGEWSLSSKVGWCEVKSQTGFGDTRVEIKIRANVNDKARTGSLLLMGQDLQREIVISQAGLFLNVDTTTIMVGNQGDSSDIAVYSNGNWAVECNSDWLHISPVSGADTGSFRITVDPSNNVRQREVILNVKAGMIVRQVRIRQAPVDGNFHAHGELKLYRAEDEGNPVKLVFMGDGFIDEDMVEGGAYDLAMNEAIEAYLSAEPYKTYRNYFCPYIVYAVSNERGMTTLRSDGGVKVSKNTFFGLNMKENTTLMNANLDLVLSYARKVPGLITTKTSIVVVANDSRYAGTCYHWGNGQTVSLVPMNRDLRPPGGFDHLITHEGAGHGFGRLHDEYTGNGQITGQAISDLGNSHNSGQFLNVTTSTDPATVYWHDFIGRPGYELVGFFEGAATYAKGVWRCEKESCMINNILYFSVACRLSIVKRLKSIAGENFDLGDFIARDIKKAPDPEQLATYQKDYVPYYYPAPTPPILVK